MKTGIFPCGGLCCQGGTNIYCTWLYFLTYSVRIQKTVGGVAPQASASSWLSAGLCLGRTRLRPRVMYPKPKSEPGLVLKECSRRVTAGKKKPGMLKQNGNERFYHNFFFISPVCQKPTPPTGREMNSPSAAISESPLLFPIKTFLCLCTFSFFFPQEVRGWVSNLLLTGHTMTSYALKFHRLGKKNDLLLAVVRVYFLTPTCWVIQRDLFIYGIFFPSKQQKEPSVVFVVFAWGNVQPRWAEGSAVFW